MLPQSLHTCGAVIHLLPQLRSLDITCVYHSITFALPLIQDYNELMNVVGRCPRLIDFGFGNLMTSDAALPASKYATDPLHSLYTVPGIQQLRLHSHDPLGEVALERIGRTWPQLRYLSILDSGVQKSSYAQILSLARLCPSLSIVHLYIDSPTPDPELMNAVFSGEIQPAQIIKYLVLPTNVSIQIQDRTRVAQFLLCAFPGLEGITRFAPNGTRCFGDMQELFHRSYCSPRDDHVLGPWKEMMQIMRRIKK